ncbi:uncharacterized protein LOC122031262 [Zingiber officinale]|uniref:uncharacterized protein LOC122031262 n=1 Tax=Zingiber officinale TaxID=94328 RepID=UPI001C4D680A|nr:uncharacterized protein LOC122031262 [Zingiber officinale]
MVRVEARKNQRMQDGGVHAVQEEPLTMAEEPIPWEEVQLYAERPESLTCIASDLPPPLKEELVQCLIHNRDVFAWSIEELLGVKPEVAEHKLHLLPDARPVKQKKRNFSADQNKIIRAEVDQLRKAGHVREVQFPAWLSNVVLVPQTLKETQKLVGRIISLSRFISRSADRASPFFKVLRKASKFKWDEECTRAFEELKKYLEALPSLFKPVVEEPLWVYLSATPEVVGVVLVKEQDNVQWSVYFFNHLLKGVESRYTTLENLVYGLVLMARRLRPYFLAHPIMIMTNSTMGRALTNIEMAGRLIKWATELGEYDIQYQPRTAIKAQALADILTKIHQTNSEETWKVYVDGSTTHQGSGVGVLLISPQGDILQLVVRLNFHATNNEAEYEALLAGLQVARHVEAARVIIYSDSQLVTHQVAGNFVVNCDKLQVYREAYEKMEEEFVEVTVTKFPRAENEKADELAKITSSLTT